MQAVDPRGQDRLHGGRHLGALGTLGQTIAAPLADQRAGFDQCADALLEKERVAIGPLDEQAFERPQRVIPSSRAEQRIEQLVGARGWQAGRAAAAGSRSSGAKRAHTPGGS